MGCSGFLRRPKDSKDSVGLAWFLGASGDVGWGAGLAGLRAFCGWGSLLRPGTAALRSEGFAAVGGSSWAGLGRCAVISANSSSVILPREPISRHQWISACKAPLRYASAVPPSCLATSPWVALAWRRICSSPIFLFFVARSSSSLRQARSKRARSRSICSRVAR